MTRLSFFTSFARIAAQLPRFRGRTRVLLELYKLLRLKRQPAVVEATLTLPVPFEAELDLHAWSQRVAFLTGGYEDDTVQFLAALHAARGGTGYLLDVGANVGMLAIPFAKMTAPVVAVEAVPDNVAALMRNIARNGLSDRVTVLAIALGDVAKTASIQVEGDLARGEGTGTANILASGSTFDCIRQELNVETLDELAASGRMPRGCTVVKIDTDGYDLKVLEGGTEFLRRERPVIYGEFSAHCMRWHDQGVEDVIAFAAAHDYEVWRRVMPGWTFSTAIDAAVFEQDALLVPAELRPAFAPLLS